MTPDVTAMAKIVERMTALGWIRSSVVTPKALRIEWTEAGEAALTGLSGYLFHLRYISAPEEECLLYLVSEFSPPISPLGSGDAKP